MSLWSHLLCVFLPKSRFLSSYNLRLHFWFSTLTRHEFAKWANNEGSELIFAQRWTNLHLMTLSFPVSWLSPSSTGYVMIFAFAIFSSPHTKTTYGFTVSLQHTGTKAQKMSTSTTLKYCIIRKLWLKFFATKSLLFEHIWDSFRLDYALHKSDFAYFINWKTFY